MGASPDGILLFPLLSNSCGEYEPETLDPSDRKQISLSAVERDIARAVLAAGGGTAAKVGGSGGENKRNISKKRSANARKKKKKMKKNASSSSSLSTSAAAAAAHDDDDKQKQNDADPSWGAAIPPGYAAVAVEVKVSSPFRWSTSGLTSFNNMVGSFNSM